MARISKITRTINTKVVTVKGFNTATAEAETRDFFVDPHLKYNEEYLKYIKKVHAPTDFVPALVEKVEVKSALYSMNETDFIAHATVIAEKGE